MSSFQFNQDPEPEDQFGEEPTGEEEQPAEENSNNRTFMIVAGALGGIVLLALICLGAFWLLRPGGSGSAEATNQAISANNTQVAVMFTQTAQALLLPPTNAAIEMLTPTNTPVIAQASATPEPPTLTPDPLTATVAALYTQAAVNALTVVPTSTALGTALAQPSQVPATGFADEVGLPGLMIMSIVLVAVILLARRLRAAPTTR